MSIGTIAVAAVLLAVVVAIVVNMVRGKQQGKSVGCDGCGKCDGLHADECAAAQDMVARMEQEAAKQ